MSAAEFFFLLRLLLSYNTASQNEQPFIETGAQARDLKWRVYTVRATLIKPALCMLLNMLYVRVLTFMYNKYMTNAWNASSLRKSISDDSRASGVFDRR
jgi:hypothetical protein